jgi:hypothetical protein
VDVPVDPTAPLANFGVWLPLGTLAGFGGLSVVDVVAFPNAVLAVTLLAALAWVGVGFGGRRTGGVTHETDPDPNRSTPTETPSLPAAALLYLTATTAVGWAVVLLLFP